MYSHPKAQPKYYPGDIVEHWTRPGMPLVIVDQLPNALDGGNRWVVRTPEDEEVPVLERNLIK